MYFCFCCFQTVSLGYTMSSFHFFQTLMKNTKLWSETLGQQWSKQSYLYLASTDSNPLSFCTVFGNLQRCDKLMLQKNHVCRRIWNSTWVKGFSRYSKQKIKLYSVCHRMRDVSKITFTLHISCSYHLYWIVKVISYIILSIYVDHLSNV